MASNPPGQAVILRSIGGRDLNIDANGDLQVDVLSGGGAGEQYASGDIAVATNKGNISIGKGTDNKYYPATVDGSGHLQVDVLSGGGGGTLKQDGEAIAGSDTANIVCGKDLSGTAQFLDVDTTGKLKIIIGDATAPIGISGDVNIVPSVNDAANQPLSVRLSDGSGYYNALSSSLPLTIGTITAPVGVSGDVSTKPLAGQVWPINDNSGSLTIDGTVSISGPITVGGITASVGISGDVSTKPLAGQVWPVSDNSSSLTIDGSVNIGNVPSVIVQSIQGPIDVSGDVTVSSTNLDIRDLTSVSDSVSATQSGTWNIGTITTLPVITIGGITTSIGVSGDVSVKPKAGEVFPVSDNAGSLTIDGSVNIGTMPVVTIGNVTTPIGISGDVSVTPKSGTTWYVDNASGQTVDVNVAGTISSLPALAAGDNNIGNIDIVTLPNISISKIYDSIDVSGDVTVSATNLDIRDLTSVSDSIASVQSGTWNVGTVASITNPVTVNIASGVNSTFGISGDAGVELIDSAGTNRATIYSTGAIRVSGDIILGPGSNAVGKLSPNSGVDIGDVDVTSIASGDTVIGRVYVQGGVGSLFNVSNYYTAAQAGVVIKTPASGKRVLLRGVTFTTATAGTMYISGDTTGLSITPVMQFAANGGAVISDPLGIWNGAVNDSISVRTNIAGNHGVTIWGTEN